MRRATRHNKRDQSEPAIRKALAKMGVAVLEAPPLDLWVHIGQWIPTECKTGNAPLTPGQKDFIRESQQSGHPYLVLRSVDDAIDAVNAIRRTVMA